MKWRIAQAGITMLELLMAITIAGILMAIGVPSYKYITNNNRVSSEINNLSGDLQYARYEAIREGQAVTICPVASNTGSTCSGTATWQTGWVVLSNAGAVLRRQPSFTSLNSNDTLTSTISSATGTGTTTAYSVVFNREGLPGLGGYMKFSAADSAGIAAYTHCLVLAAGGAINTAGNGQTALGVSCP